MNLGVLVLTEDGLDMSLGVALYGVLGEELAWLHETILLFVDGVSCFLFCCA